MKTFVTIVFALSLAPPLAAQANVSDQYQHTLNNEIKRAHVSPDQLGIAVIDEKGQQLFGLNENRFFIPASLTKLLTASAALDAFTPADKFITQLVSNGLVDSGALRGDLYLKGGGDPAFVSEKMWYLVNEFVRTGIKYISGNIVVDDNLFDSVRVDPGRDADQYNRAYDAPIGAMSINWNSVNVYVRPGRKNGDAAQVGADPQSGYISLVNRVKTGGSAVSITIERLDTAQGDQIRVSGQIPASSGEVVKYVAISKPDLWSGYQLLEFLHQRGIQVQGGVTIGHAPNNATVLAKNDDSAAALYEVLADMLKFSNNYIAEMLTKQLAVKAGEIPATMPTGLEEIRRRLFKHGLTAQDYSLTSPSGLSRKNKIKPRKLAGLLQSVRKDLRSYPELMAGLPIAGLDGTLKSRMKNTPAAEHVRGKTGLLASVGAVGLAGFAARPDGSDVIYVFIYNGSKGIVDIWSLFDAMASRLVE